MAVAKNLKLSKGFTLVEMLFVILVLGIVINLGSNLLFTILRGATKVELEKEVKQNGDYAMNVMERMVRNARRVDSCGSGSLQIDNPDGGTTTFLCLYDEGAGKIASQSGAFPAQALTGKEVTVASGSDCTTSSLSFACTSLPQVPQTVDIFFTLWAGTAGGAPEQRAQVSFQTTVSLRTY
jgi:prepilin-type N-terminal cleavage/methylation domain-containing protein